MSKWAWLALKRFEVQYNIHNAVIILQHYHYLVISKQLAVIFCPPVDAYVKGTA